MTRTRLRPAFTDEELAVNYAAPPDYSLWPGHEVRLKRTAELAAEMWSCKKGTLIADLSAGNGEVTEGFPPQALVLGDLVAGYEYEGPIERTIDEIPQVELFILSETLEHLDDPDAVLVKIRGKCDKLLLTTPHDEVVENPEHYWSWDTRGVFFMLTDAGFTELRYELLIIAGFTFQIWRCS